MMFIYFLFWIFFYEGFRPYDWRESCCDRSSVYFQNCIRELTATDNSPESVCAEYILFSSGWAYLIIMLIASYLISCLIVWLYNRSKRKYIGLIAGIITYIIASFLLINFVIFLTNYFSGISAVPLDLVKNEGCRNYIQQTPACTDWTKVNVIRQGKSITFKEFMNTYYSCQNEICVRNICGCPGY